MPSLHPFALLSSSLHKLVMSMISSSRTTRTGPGIAWVKRDDLGEASARLIARYAAGPAGFPFKNDTVLLTGPRVWSLQETVEALGRNAGNKDLRIRQVSVDEYVKLPQVWAVFGAEEKVRTWSTAWDEIRAGETAVVTTTLVEVLGRCWGGSRVGLRRRRGSIGWESDVVNMHEGKRARSKTINLMIQAHAVDRRNIC